MEDLQILGPLLALQKIPGLGLAGLHKLLTRYPHPGSLLQAAPELGDCLPAPLVEQFASLQKAGNSHPIWQQVHKELDYLDANDIHAVTLRSSLYPRLLKETCHPPLVLYVKGDPALLSGEQLAVVGSRKSGKAATDMAFHWADELAQTGITITSGLALGIDGAAHAGALHARGRTVAVLAHGLDLLYPAQHRQMAEEVAASGALVSEFAIGTPLRRENFPRRNRVISGLSMGVLVIEAALKSGSLITARYALEQNREVFAVPGSICNPMVKGCHYLIKEGACLVESPQEILEALRWQTACQKPLFADELFADELLAGDLLAPHPLAATTGFASHLSQEGGLLLQQIPFELIHLDEIMANTALGIADVTRELVMLEIDGYIETIAGNYRRIK